MEYIQYNIIIFAAYSPVMQWAAVTIHLSFMTIPPQKWEFVARLRIDAWNNY